MCETPIPVAHPNRGGAHVCPAATTQVRQVIPNGALDELRFHWGSAYHLAIIDGVCTARRKDGRGGALTSPVPEGLRLLIVADYTAMPVPRDLP